MRRHQSYQPQQLDPRMMRFDPAWKEMQPMIATSACGKYASATTPRSRQEPDYGEWGFQRQMSLQQQQHLERDYATTLQMRRTAVPSLVMGRSIGDHASSSGCICPLHGLHPSASVSVIGDPIAVHPAWTTGENCGVGNDVATEASRKPSTAEVGTTTPARFSTFRPRVEHIYEVPRFADGQDDDCADFNDYDGVPCVVSSRADDNGNENGCFGSPLYSRQLDATRSFAFGGVRLPSESGCCGGNV